LEYKVQRCGEFIFSMCENIRCMQIYGFTKYFYSCWATVHSNNVIFSNPIYIYIQSVSQWSDIFKCNFNVKLSNLHDTPCIYIPIMECVGILYKILPFYTITIIYRYTYTHIKNVYLLCSPNHRPGMSMPGTDVYNISVVPSETCLSVKIVVRLYWLYICVCPSAYRYLYIICIYVYIYIFICKYVGLDAAAGN